MKLEKNDNTYNYYYSTFKAEYAKSTGLPLYANTVKEYNDVAEIYISASRCKKLKKDTEGADVVAFYRVMNGYIPLYDVRTLKDIEKQPRKRFTGVKATEENTILAICLISNSYKNSILKHNNINKEFDSYNCELCSKNKEVQNIHHCKIECTKHDLYKQLLGVYEFKRVIERILSKLDYMGDILTLKGYTVETVDGTEYIQNVYVSKKDNIIFTVPTRYKDGYYVNNVVETCIIIPFDFSEAMDILKRYIKRCVS